MELFLKFVISLLSLYNLKGNVPEESNDQISNRNSSGLLKMDTFWNFRLFAAISMKCLEIPGAATEIPTQADIWDCTDPGEVSSDHQTWFANTEFLTGKWNMMQMKNVKSGACLGIIGGNTNADGAPVGQTQCKESTSGGQFWAMFSIDGPDTPLSFSRYRIHNLNGKCLTIDGDSSQRNGAKLVLRECNFIEPNQVFKLKEDDKGLFWL